MGRRFVPNWNQRNRVRVHPSQLDAWYRTLDQLHKAKERIEEALYHRLRDLFSFLPWVQNGKPSGDDGVRRDACIAS